MRYFKVDHCFEGGPLLVSEQLVAKMLFLSLRARFSTAFRSFFRSSWSSGEVEAMRSISRLVGSDTYSFLFSAGRRLRGGFL